MTVKIFVPRDSTAVALGANQVANAIVAEAKSRGVAIQLVRIAFGPVIEEDVASLFEAGFTEGKAHALALGKTDDIPYLKNQERLTFARVGITDPVSLDDYLAHEGYVGLKNALKLSEEQIVKTVTDSGLRGRGGAAFPTGIKWETVRKCAPGQKYIVCNADEGDSGTFSDRMVMEDDPFMLIEGMTISGLAVGPTRATSMCAPSIRMRSSR